MPTFYFVGRGECHLREPLLTKDRAKMWWDVLILEPAEAIP